jgi:hypothetical protein
MTAYYNEIDGYAAQWLRNLIAEGLIPQLGAEFVRAAGAAQRWGRMEGEEAAAARRSQALAVVAARGSQKKCARLLRAA